MKAWICAAIAAAFGLAGTAYGTLIASETFTANTAAEAPYNGYVNNENFIDARHSSNVIGNVGFSAETPWQFGTALAVPRDNRHLTHDLLVGAPATGYVQLITGQSGGIGVARNSQRDIASIPESSTYFMSGLVFVGLLERLHDGGVASMGVSAPVGHQDFSTSGFHLGLTRTNDNAYLAAIAGGNVYTLGPALAENQYFASHMIVLQLDIGAGATDTLRAWYALQGQDEFAFAGQWTGLDTADSTADLARFIVQTMGGDNPTNAPIGVAMDEWRFGTTFASVAIPEPMNAVLWGLGAGVLWIMRRRRVAG